jgi:hypothetical protein
MGRGFSNGVIITPPRSARLLWWSAAIVERLAMLAIAAVMAVGVSGQPNKASKTEQQVSASPNPRSDSPDPPKNTNNGQADQSNPNPDLPKRYAPLERPDWWLVILGFGTLAVVLWQTIQTKKAAQAALLSAQAVIDAERAWLTVSITDKLKPLTDSPKNRAENERRQLSRLLGEDNEAGKIYFVSLRNQGRTPARILRGDFTHRFVKTPDELPVPVSYSGPIILPDPTFIVSKEAFQIRPGINPYSILDEAKKKVAVGFSIEFLIFYGRIIYEDVFASGDGKKGVHETRWCFAYFLDGRRHFVACGPAEYNGHT